MRFQERGVRGQGEGKIEKRGAEGWQGDKKEREGKGGGWERGEGRKVRDREEGRRWEGKQEKKGKENARD